MNTQEEGITYLLNSTETVVKIDKIDKSLTPF